MIVEAGKSKICRAGQQARNSGRISILVLWQNSFSGKPQIFALTDFKWLDEAHLHHQGLLKSTNCKC